MVGGTVLLIGLHEFREDQMHCLAVRLVDRHVQLPAQFVGKERKGLLLLPHPGEEEGVQAAAVHQCAAAPEGHAVVEAEGLEAAAVEQGVVPHLLQRGGQRQVRQAAVVPLGLFIREAAGDQHLLPLRSGGGGGREGMAPQLRHRQAEQLLR